MRPFALEPATLRDLGELRQLEKECFDQDAWPLIDLVGVLSLPGIIRIKAIVDEMMVGFAAAESHAAERVGWITTVGVLPAYRRQGIARALLAACEARIPMPRVRLSVRYSNQPALLLYQGLGYTQVEIWKHYYPGGEDARVLEKILHHES